MNRPLRVLQTGRDRANLSERQDMLFAIIVNGIALGCIYGLVALGFSLIFRAMGLLNFAQSEMLSLGALVGFSVIVTLGQPYIVGVVVAVIVGGGVSLAIERLVYAPIRMKEGVASSRSVFATIAMLIIISNGAKAIWGSDAFSYPQVGSVLKWGGFSVSTTYLLVIAVTAVVMVGLNLILFRTNMGLAMRAYADDASTASLMGIEGVKVAGATSFLAGALGAVGGVLLAQIYYAAYDLGSFGLKAFAAAILGGFGSIIGAVVGGLIIGVFENLVAITISTAYKDAIVFMVFIAVLLFKPSGIFKA